MRRNECVLDVSISRMRTMVLFVLTFSGLPALDLKTLKEYHYVNESMTWDEAQSYCREAFTDLATVRNKDEDETLQSVLPGHGKYAWLGLYDNLAAWKWSMINVTFNNDFTKWKTSHPDNLGSNESCAVITIHGLWLDLSCSLELPSVCYYEQGPPYYILVESLKTWDTARSFCRSNYTDLASVRNITENEEISSLLSTKAWIGLHRRPWDRWSDRTYRRFTKWNIGQPDNDGETMASCVAVNTTTTTWWDVDCNTMHHFVCQEIIYPPPRVLRRTMLKFQSDADLNDPAAQQQILEQIHTKMEEYRLSDFKLRWIVTDGQTFHKEEKGKK